MNDIFNLKEITDIDHKAKDRTPGSFLVNMKGSLSFCANNIRWERGGWEEEESLHCMLMS